MTAQDRQRLEVGLVGVGTRDAWVSVRLFVGPRLRAEHAVPAADLPAQLTPGAKVPTWTADLERYGLAGRPLWLAFRPPFGVLPAFDWEGAVGRVTGAIVVREGRDVAARTARPNALTVVLLAGVPPPAPHAGLAVSDLVVDLFAAPVDEVRVHLFADPNCEPSDLPNRPGRTAVGHRPPDRPVTDSWLPWVLDRLPPDEAVDVVHFFGTGRRTDADGAVTLGRPPTISDRMSAVQASPASGATSPGPSGRRVPVLAVGADAVVGLLDRLGAWAVGFAQPAGGDPDGLRLLADAVARRRPGPVFVHPQPPAGRGPAAALYGGLFAADGLPRDAGLTAYLDPDRLTAKGGGDTTAAAKPPRWKVVTRRFLEQHAGPLSGTGADTLETFEATGRSITAADAGRAAAVQFLQQLHDRTDLDDKLASARPVVNEYADRLDEAVRSVLDLDDTADPALASAGVSRLTAEVGNAERLLANLAGHELPSAAELVASLGEQRDHLRAARDQLSDLVGAAVDPTRPNPDASATAVAVQATKQAVRSRLSGLSDRLRAAAHRPPAAGAGEAAP